MERHRNGLLPVGLASSPSEHSGFSFAAQSRRWWRSNGAGRARAHVGLDVYDVDMSAAELDVADAIERRERAAATAKRLEEDGDGWAALAAWKEYELISTAIAAQERSRAAEARAHAGELTHGR